MRKHGDKAAKTVRREEHVRLAPAREHGDLAMAEMHRNPAAKCEHHGNDEQANTPDAKAFGLPEAVVNHEPKTSHDDEREETKDLSSGGT